MVAFNNVLQKMVPLSGLKMESGAGVTIAGVSGQSFTITSKMRKVLGGFGVMDTDGMVAVATPGLVDSTGQITFKRKGNVETSADTITYYLWGH